MVIFYQRNEITCLSSIDLVKIYL